MNFESSFTNTENVCRAAISILEILVG